MNMTEGTFLVLEGLDGVGKSTTSEVFSDIKDYQRLKSPNDDYYPSRSNIDENYDAQTRSLFYLSSNLALSDKAEELLERGENVVADRYFPSTVAYHNPLVDGDLMNVVDEFDFVMPDQFFLLHIEEDIRRERLERRGGATEEETNMAYINQVVEEYNALEEDFDMTRIRTEPGVENVVNKIWQEVK